jgi:hypothetical protein
MQTAIDVPALYQFAEDFCLVVDNDYKVYTEIMEMEETKVKNMSGLSDKLRAQFEAYVSEVAEREKESGREVGALLISQMLLNWGSPSWDLIAKHYIGLKTEEVSA